MDLRNKLKFCRIEYGSARYRETVRLRERVLREPLGLRFTAEQLQAEYPYHHLIALLDDHVVGCLYLIAEPEGRIRLKQFVIAPEWQGQGAGKLLMEYTENFCRLLNCTEIYMHARQTAVPFYLEMGYEIYDEPFQEIGLSHRKMRKLLKAKE